MTQIILFQFNLIVLAYLHIALQWQQEKMFIGNILLMQFKKKKEKKLFNQWH